MAKETFQKYQDEFDRKAFGAGSQKDTDRFSGLDVRKMFDARGGLSKAEGAQMVLDYADKAKGEGARMGGGTEDALNQLRGYLGGETSAETTTTNPDIKLSERAATSIGGVKGFEDAQASGLLSDMRFPNEDGTDQENAFTKYRDTYKGNVKKALSNNAGIEAGDTSDTGTSGGGEYTFQAKDKSDVAKQLVGKGAGLQDLIL